MATSNDCPVKEFYPLDLVYKFDDDKHIVLGVVAEWSDNEETPSLQKDHIPVLWNNSNRRQICKQSKLHLMSRNLERGDLVRRLQDGKETQRGYLKRIKGSATVQIVESDKVIQHVADTRLCFVKPFEVGDAVCLKEKFGRIQNIEYTIWMQSKCGSLVEVSTTFNYGIHDLWSHGKYEDLGYPGQVVVCIPMCLRNPKWIKKSKAMMRKVDIKQSFTILRIVPCNVEIWWVVPNGCLEEVTDDEIKLLRVLPVSENAIVGDRQFLKLKCSDIAIKKREWRKKKFDQCFLINEIVPVKDNQPEHNLELEKMEDDWFTEEDTDSQGDESGSDYKRSSKKPNRRRSMLSKCTPGTIVPVEVLSTDNRATVVWQDGTEEKNIPTTELYYSVALDNHEFFPGDYVIPSNTNASDRYGVVQKVDFLERTASIKWFSYSEVDKKPKELSTEEASVYDIKAHPKFLFRPGNVVRAKPLEENRMGKIMDCSPQGFLKMHWLDESRGECWPQHLEVLPQSEYFDYPDDFFSANDLSDDDRSWETESVESFEGDVIDDVNLQVMASKLDFIRSRIAFLMEAARHHSVTGNFQFVKDLLCVYDNSSYLDKYLGTSFFSLESKHFQTLLLEAKKKAKTLGIELTGRIFSSCSSKERVFSGGSTQTEKLKSAEKDNIEKMIKLENKVNAQIESYKELIPEESCPVTPDVPVCDPLKKPLENNLSLELLHMLKARMDLVYAEILSRIGSRDALTALTDNANKNSSHFSTVAFDLPSSPIVAIQSQIDDNAQEEAAPPTQITEEPAKSEAFSVLEEAPDTHRYYSSKFEPKDVSKFSGALRKEYKLLKEALPPGVWVRTYESRMDLLSVMIRGPCKTPYEDGLFLFDIQLSSDYPKSPPFVHFISYSSHALNPNLYVEGKVCVSLLGTWSGRGSEVWTANSTLLQIVVSIQGLILVAEPFYNEAGYEKHANTQQGTENSRTYNEFVLLKLVQSMTELLNAAPKIFRKEILEHFRENGEKMCDRLSSFCEDDCALEAEFPLLPVSKGLKLSLKSAVAIFRSALKSALH